MTFCVVFVEHTWCMLNIRYVCLVNSVALCWFGIRGSPYIYVKRSVHGICLIYVMYV